MPRKAAAIRVCRSAGCELEAAPRRQWCDECWTARQPPVVRAEIAKRRLSLIPEEYRRARVPEKEWPPGRRWCAGCQTMVRLEDVSGSRCKSCASIASHKSRVKSTYGIDDATWQWMYDKQLGRCAICRGRAKTSRFAVDHEHGHAACGGTGCPECVRGLLCERCNRELLGAAHDSLAILENAVAYMRNPPLRGEWEPPASEVEAWEAKYGVGTPPAPF